MANTFAPPFPQTPILGAASITTALTARTNITGTTGLTLLVASQTNGFRLDAISIKASATSAAGQVFVWLYDGTTARLIDEILQTAITGSTTVASDYNIKQYQNFNVPTNTSLYVSGTITQNYNVTAYGAAY